MSISAPLRGTSPVALRGIARVGKRTKDLVKRLSAGDIAIIDHEDLDEVASDALVLARVKGVVNVQKCISGRFPNDGPLKLLDAGITVIDATGPAIMSRVKEGEEIKIVGNLVLARGKVVGIGKRLTREDVLEDIKRARANLAQQLDAFVQNTMDYALKEKALILGDLPLPDIKAEISGKHVLVVVRGRDYREDLAAIGSYINEVKPVKIGVDGGADALLEMGIKPDIIIGDMDSVSDEALKCGAEIIVHAYPDGRAPGLARVEGLGLRAKVVPAPGTSEDIALLLAYEKGASLIVAVGTHSNMIDFLEKGRKGMASTFLVRLKVGSILVDAKGVNKLYPGKMKTRYLLQIAAAAIMPLIIVAAISDPTRQFLRLLFLKLRVLLNLL